MTRLQPNDCLTLIRKDLEQAVRSPMDSEGWKDWLLTCADLLAHVPDIPQRYAWAYSLVNAIDRRFSIIPIDILMNYILAAAQLKAAHEQEEE